MGFWNKLKSDFRAKKKILAIGTIVGALAYLSHIGVGGDVLFSVQSAGIIDNVAGGLPTESLAHLKTFLAFIVFGWALALMANWIIDKVKR